MKKIVTLLLMLFIVNTFGKPTVVSIGTIHHDTQNFSSDDLYEVLACVEPDVILVERDKYMLGEDGWYADIENPGLEEKAVRKYRLEKDFSFHPYDYEGRKKYKTEHKFSTHEKKLDESIKRLVNSGSLSKLSVEKLNGLNALTAPIINGLANDPIRVINASVMVELFRARKNNIYDTYAFLIKESNDLRQYSEYWQKARDFWVKRNDAMVANILKWSKKYPESIIVVLSGVSHKYYLKDGLLGSNELVDYKEYWEFPNCQE